MLDKLSQFLTENKISLEWLPRMAKELKGKRDLIPFTTWPGYAAVMAAMPEMTLAITKHNKDANGAAVSAYAFCGLISLYEKMLDLEKEQKSSEYTIRHAVNVKDDFTFAVKLLMARLPWLDPAEPDKNANEIIFILDGYKERMCKASTDYRLIDVKQFLQL